MPPVSPGATLKPAGGVGEAWILTDDAGVEVARYDWATPTSASS